MKNISSIKSIIMIDEINWGKYERIMYYQFYKKLIVDQNKCGSGWAHAIAGAIQGATRLRGGNRRLLSAQQLINCVKTSKVCQGGNIPDTLKYIVKSGLYPAKLLKYEGKKTECPKLKKKKRNWQ